MITPFMLMFALRSISVSTYYKRSVVLDAYQILVPLERWLHVDIVSLTGHTEYEAVYLI